MIMEGVSGRTGGWQRKGHTEKAHAHRRGLPKVTMSLGVVFADELEPRRISSRADRALYFVKDHGRNGYCIYEKNMAQRDLRR